jgi:hypothetical protein
MRGVSDAPASSVTSIPGAGHQVDPQAFALEMDIAVGRLDDLPDNACEELLP